MLDFQLKTFLSKMSSLFVRIFFIIPALFPSCLQIDPSPLDSSENPVILFLPVLLEPSFALATVYPAADATNVAPCDGSPCLGNMRVRFTRPMRTDLTHSLTAEIWDGTVFDPVATDGTRFAWSKTFRPNDTLNIYISWIWFPETSKIRFTLPASQFQSTVGDNQPADIQQTFDTTGNKQTFPVADTGMALCSNGGVGLVACPGGGFPSQDGDFTNVPNSRSFTGPTAHATYSADYTTIDNLTGLRWKSCTEGLSGATCATGAATAVVWEDSVNACAGLNQANSGAGYWGLSNWRLPTRSELTSIVSFAATNPSIDAANFPATVGDTYWASGSFQNSTRGYQVRFLNGTSQGASDNKDGVTTARVRCVSSPATIQLPGFSDNGDGTISDLRTGLRWQKCSRGQTNDSSCSGAATTGNWQSNLTYCDGLTLGSHANSSSWRLPNVNEFYSITFIGNTGNNVDVTYFPNTSASRYATSTTRPADGTFATNFDGSGMANNPLGTLYTARCASTE
ncbi:MAG: DUF1566 domain-containing protein [Spirochaetales bacterium]|nr:DUF1566 domain-containing protein [Spirochaetales bacterium]